MSQEPRFFQLVRHEDETGVSGTGVVALGVESPNGQVVMGWRVDGYSTSAYDSIDTVREIHGHNGRTTVEWLEHPGRAFMAGQVSGAVRIPHSSTLEQEPSWTHHGSGVMLRCGNGHLARLSPEHDVVDAGNEVYEVHPSVVCPEDGCEWHVHARLQGYAPRDEETQSEEGVA